MQYKTWMDKSSLPWNPNGYKRASTLRKRANLMWESEWKTMKLTFVSPARHLRSRLIFCVVHKWTKFKKDDRKKKLLKMQITLCGFVISKGWRFNFLSLTAPSDVMNEAHAAWAFGGINLFECFKLKYKIE